MKKVSKSKGMANGIKPWSEYYIPVTEIKDRNVFCRVINNNGELENSLTGIDSSCGWSEKNTHEVLALMQKSIDRYESEIRELEHKIARLTNLRSFLVE